ncbi:hypothetical protein Poly51_40110 [Rubripirellula tenax]|uniref:CdiI immunity protein domain-containing protein n=1 Tax=Rubripirellula tenax TaxID=2528015 RepID=A0A5C6EPC4_9BACT|nr:hypothetical protein [Rubripirellula tenax]TWU50718.1 hypothetical protein Poly51_40110 [Rubripirellula tenax]
MIDQIAARDFWCFGQLYAVLAAFADDPSNTISRIGGGRISVPDDQANELHNFRTTVLANYPDAAELELMQVVARVDSILSERSRGSAQFDEYFWTNKAFADHPDWDRIRMMAREFLVR